MSGRLKPSRHVHKPEYHANFAPSMVTSCTQFCSMDGRQRSVDVAAVNIDRMSHDRVMSGLEDGAAKPTTIKLNDEQ